MLYEDGTFADLSEVDPAVWHAWETRESYSVTLENGYLAEKEWIPNTEGSSDGHMRTVVYDQDGNTVFCLESSGIITITMYDSAGNSMQANYTHRSLDDDGSTYESDPWTSTVYPMDRTTYNAQEDVRRDYTTVKNLMRLASKYEYNTAEGNVCHFYDLILDVGAYDMDDDYYETLSYSDRDLTEYMLSAPVYDASTGDYYYDTFPTTVPSQKRINGVDPAYWDGN